MSGVTQKGVYRVYGVFYPIGHPLRLGLDAVCVWFGIGPWIQSPFSLQTYPSHARLRITFEPIKGPNLCFRKRQSIFAHNFTRMTTRIGHWNEFRPRNALNKVFAWAINWTRDRGSVRYRLSHRFILSKSRESGWSGLCWETTNS